MIFLSCDPSVLPFLLNGIKLSKTLNGPKGENLKCIFNGRLSFSFLDLRHGI